MAKTPTWQRAEGKSESGGLNEKGRASLRAAGHDIKRPQPEGGPRKRSFCARMEGMKRENTSAETANDPNSRINKSLRKWKCADGGAVDPYDAVQQAAKGGEVWDKPRPKKLGKPEPLSSKEKASAKAAAKAAGRPYPNLIDNMRAARADGGELVDPYDDVQRAAQGATPAVDPVTVTEHYAPSTPQADMFRQAYNEAVPFPARALMSGAVGVHSPITEKDVTPEDRAEIIRQTQNQQKNNAAMEGQIRDNINMSPSQYEHRQNIGVAPDMPFGDYRNYMNKALQSFERTRGKTSVSYDPSLHSINPDTGETKFSPYEEGKSGLIQSAQRAYSDPAYRVGMTLGHYNVYDTPKGRVVLDKYNFDMPNAASKNIPLSASDFSQNFMKSLRVAVPQYAPNISRPVAINLDAKPNRTYEYTGPAITTPGSAVASDETMTPSQDAIEPPHKMIAPNFAAMMNRPKNQGNYADGGQVEGDVQFADDDPYAKVQEAAKLPMMAQNDFAMHMPQPEVRYDTGPQPGEAELKAYDPTIKERIYQGIAGTEERPSPERAQFARGMSQMAEFAPVLGNVMAGQEAQRRGDTKGMLMAALPVPGMATEARMAEAAISPAQEAAREAYQRVLNAQGLYSHAAEAAYNLPQAKGSYEQMMAMLQKAGVKPEEMRWSGVEQFAGQPVTREQLASHFEQNVPKIEETVLGSPDETKLNEADAAVREAIRAYNEGQVAPRYYAHNPERSYASSFFPTREEAEAHIPTLPASYHAGTTVEEFPGKPIDVYETMRRLHNGEFVYNLPPGVNRAALNLIDERNALAEAAEQSATKFGQYTLPGGQNYREVLLHTPGQKQDLYKQISQAREDRIAAVKEHGSVLKYDDPALEQERLQKIREATKRENDLRAKLENIAPEFTSAHWDQPNVLGHLRMSDRTGPEGEKILHLEELQSDWGQQGRQRGFGSNKLSPDEEAEYYKLHGMMGSDRNEAQQARLDELIDKMNWASRAVPSAPYVEKTQNWVDLGLKRALKEAAEGGYSKMVWTPGEEQAARYDLSQQIGSITARPTPDGKIHLEALTPDMGSVVHNGVHNPNDIDDIIGKELADKIRSQIQFPEIESGFVVRNKRSGNQSNVFKTKEDAEDMLKNYPESLRKDLIIAEGSRTTHGRAAELSGLDLKVGGEGMKGFYDKIVPTRLKELLKKIDPQAKVETDYIKTGDEWPFSARIASDGESYWLAGNSPYAEGEQRLSGKFSSYADADKQRELLYAGYHKPVHSITITPKMREAILKGLPAYARGGEVVNNDDPYDNIRLKAKNFPRARRASH